MRKVQVGAFGMWSAASLLAACASTPGAEPGDMSAAQHEAAGQEHTALAGRHADEYSPEASATETACRQGTAKPGEVCWTSEVNPTAEHKQEADRHRKHSQDHRAASQELLSAEANACEGIAEADRDISPFAHREDIERVEPLVEREGKQNVERTVGSVVTFRAVPGLTREWLQRAVDCHLARNAALGNSDEEMTSCPLVPKGVTAQVSSTGSGFAVAIRAPDTTTAKQVIARAEKLK
jgi:hypothetical protein